MNWLTAVQLGLSVIPQLLKVINTVVLAVEETAPPQSGPAKAQMVEEMVDAVITSADQVASGDGEVYDAGTKEMLRSMIRPSTDAVVRFHNTVGNFDTSRH